MKIKLLKLLDRLAGGIAASSLPAARLRPVPVPRRVLFIRPGGIGDAILLVPAIRALMTAHPDCRIEILAEKRNAAAFGLTSGIGSVFCYDSPNGIASVLRGGYDVVIDTEQWYRLSAVIARLTRAPMIIGFASNERSRLFTHPVPYAMDRYEAYSFLGLLEPLGIELPGEIAPPFLELPAAAVGQAEQYLAPLDGRPFLTLFPGASTPEKQWGAGNFRSLVTKISDSGFAVVVVGGADVRGVAAELAGAGRVLDLTGTTSLAATAAVIGKGRALVSGDSGLLHIAAGLGTPTVSLFGPSDPVKWAPHGDRDVVCCAGLPCSPCSRFGTIPPCPDQARCIGEIAVAEVMSGIEKVLA